MVDNVRLPVAVEKGAVGGPRYKVIKQVAMSGRQQRIQQWDDPIWQWDIGYALQRANDAIDDVLNMYMARGGPEIPFRFKSWQDYEADNQLIGTGDGTTDTFQLTKLYADAAQEYLYTIRLPVSGTVVIIVAGVTKTETTHYTVNYSTGVVTFTGGNIPTSGQAVRAWCEFDRAVIFEDDQLKISTLRGGDTGIASIPRITITEVLDE